MPSEKSLTLYFLPLLALLASAVRVQIPASYPLPSKVAGSGRLCMRPASPPRRNGVPCVYIGAGMRGWACTSRRCMLSSSPPKIFHLRPASFAKPASLLCAASNPPISGELGASMRDGEFEKPEPPILGSHGVRCIRLPWTGTTSRSR